MSDIGQEETAALYAQLLIEEKRRRKIKLMAGSGLAFLILLTWFMLQPLRAGPEYGLCRTYLETHLRYPTTFKITQYDVFGPSLRIFYTYHDEWGGHRSDMIECIAAPHPTNGYVLQDVKINRKSIEAERLKRFNYAIPSVLAGQPDLTIPRPPGDDLSSLKRY